MKNLYNLSIYLLGIGMQLAAGFHPKAKKWVNGRKNWRRELEKINPNQQAVFWMHCASLGEFEQGRPVLEEFKNQNPNYFIALTFYSPSGYEVRSKYELADWVGYLPLDTPGNARDFVRMLRPEIFVLVKYELWLNTLHACNEALVQVYMISAIFRENHSAFRSPFKTLYQNALRNLQHLFVQDEDSQKRLEHRQIKSSVAGDTRFDRVRSITQNPKELTKVNRFKGSNRLLVVGSSWQPEEDWILNWFSRNPESDVKVLIAPHHIDSDRILGLKKKSTVKVATYSQLKKGFEGAKIMVFDTMGMLTSAYAYADFVVVGGGFNKSGIHNVLEPAAYGVPILIGPNFAKFKEARDLQKGGGLQSAKSYIEFERALIHLLENRLTAKKMGKSNKTYVQNALPATEIISNHIQKEVQNHVQPRI